ncbi:MAG: hypothetical protein L6R37_003089 [Teloschistes peruensis]|nr:MAG: hypothetical protein L6R37_003089 [Teloschistes peruensis]
MELTLRQIAVVSTIPWDSYLIHRRIWTYPADVIVGPSLLHIPAEEVFFFIIQTYNTSLLYIFASKATFHPIYLRGEKLLHDGRRLRKWRNAGVGILGAAILLGAWLIRDNGRGVYLGLIIVWAGPFILMLWSLAYQLILNLPLSNTLLPIVAPTLYLWIVDTLALRRGTWTLSTEAIFFLLTNVLIVFGLVAFDNALAILNTFPTLFSSVPSLPTPDLLVRALLVSPERYDYQRIVGLQEALQRLRKKSRSFYLASGCFQGRLRIDLILLYSFCRVADDLIDNAPSCAKAEHWILKLSEYLDICYAQKLEKPESRDDFVRSTFPAKAQLALLLLPTAYLSPTPLYDLIKGFEIDLDFGSGDGFPIVDEQTLQTYGSRVAGTVAELCIELAFYHSEERILDEQKWEIIRAGGRMGIALQYINIARDIAVDAKMKRVYLPTSWLKAKGLSPEDVLKDPLNTQVEVLRQRLLDKAMDIYGDARGAIELLPAGSRGPMRVTVESYVEIGRVLRESGYKLKAGRATVPKLRRLSVAWTSLLRG